MFSNGDVIFSKVYSTPRKLNWDIKEFSKFVLR